MLSPSKTFQASLIRPSKLVLATSSAGLTVVGLCFLGANGSGIPTSGL
jgi:hypothetical protein